MAINTKRISFVENQLIFIIIGGVILVLIILLLLVVWCRIYIKRKKALQETFDQFEAHKPTKERSNKPGFSKSPTPGNVSSIHETPGNDDFEMNSDDEIYIAQATEMVYKKDEEKTNIIEAKKQKQKSISDNFSIILEAKKTHENNLMNDMVNEMEREQNDSNYAKQISNDDDDIKQTPGNFVAKSGDDNELISDDDDPPSPPIPPKNNELLNENNNDTPNAPEPPNFYDEGSTDNLFPVTKGGE